MTGRRDGPRVIAQGPSSRDTERRYSPWWFERLGALVPNRVVSDTPPEAIFTPPGLPDEVVERTLSRYLEIYERLTGTESRVWAETRG